MNRIPTKEQILAWITDNPTLSSKRDIAKAFGIKGAARIPLKAVLKELEAEGHLEKRRKTYRDPDRLPPVSVLLVLPPNEDGDLFAKPLEWHGEGAEPVVLLLPRDSDPAMGGGDRILARLTHVGEDDHAYEARLIRRVGHNPLKILGIYRQQAEGGRIVPIDKKSDREWRVPPGASHGAKDGELVEAEQAGPKSRMGLPSARIVARLGDPSGPRAVSLIAIHQHGIPDAFPDEVIEAADKAKPMGLSGREDLRDLPLVTIDPADARDHDDAVYAAPDDATDNPGGHVVWVVIADVAAYVRPDTVIDREARKRGNSTYFPDRVVPMLPDRLSGDLCSLHEGVPRPALACRMVFDADGNKRRHSFHRVLMRSAASLTYEDAQAVENGEPASDKAQMLADSVIHPLFAAYRAAAAARDRRQPLALDLPERRIMLSDEGKVSSVAFRDRMDAHRMIEEFMVMANVCAAETLISKRRPLLFRVHEEPDPDKLEALRETAQASGLVLAKGQVLKTAHLNRLLEQASGTDQAELINLSTLRSMTQAYYTPDNLGHFGLALRCYAHFTSPIRRYADLVVHRALVTAHGWGDDGLSPAEEEVLEKTAQHISDTERRSMSAERDTTDRYLASFLSERVGSEMTGRISGVARFGLFVKLDDSGADGLVPVRSLGHEYFHHDADAQTLMGGDTGRVFAVGQRVLAKLQEAEPVTGGVLLEILEVEGEEIARTGARGRTRSYGKGKSFKKKSKSRSRDAKPPGKPRTVSRSRRK